MAGMESSHRGHETNGTVIDELFAAPLTKSWNFSEDLDRSIGNCRIRRSPTKGISRRKGTGEAWKPWGDGYVPARKKHSGGLEKHCLNLEL